MAKRNTATKATKVEATKVEATKVEATKVEATKPRTRGRAYNPADVIRVVEGEGARRVVKSLACDRTLQAIAATKGKTVGEYIATFGPLCEKQPLPGRSGQPGATQASAILRYLEREGALVVAAAK